MQGSPHKIKEQYSSISDSNKLIEESACYFNSKAFRSNILKTPLTNQRQSSNGYSSSSTSSSSKQNHRVTSVSSNSQANSSSPVLQKQQATGNIFSFRQKSGQNFLGMRSESGDLIKDSNELWLSMSLNEKKQLLQKTSSGSMKQQELLGNFLKESYSLPQINKNILSSVQQKQLNSQHSYSNSSIIPNNQGLNSPLLISQQNSVSDDQKFHLRSTSMNINQPNTNITSLSNCSYVNYTSQQQQSSQKTINQQGGKTQSARFLESSRQLSFHPLINLNKKNENTKQKIFRTTFLDGSPLINSDIAPSSSSSCYHISLKNIDTQEELRLSSLSDFSSSKKVIPLSTSNALLPQSLVSHVRNLKQISAKNTILIGSQKEVMYQENDGILMEEDEQQEITPTYFSKQQSNKIDLNSLSKLEFENEKRMPSQNFEQNFKESVNSKLNSQKDIPLSIISHELSQEQEIFQNELLQRIRNKNRQLGPRLSRQIQQIKQAIENGKKSEEFQKPLQQGEIKSLLKNILLLELRAGTSSIQKSTSFFLPNVDQEIFQACVVFIFSNALNSVLNPKYEIEIKQFNIRIPEKLFHQMKHLYETKLLDQRLSFSWEQKTKFSLFAQANYDTLNIKPLNLLEEIGGIQICKELVREFYGIFIDKFPSAEGVQQKLMQDTFVALLFEDQNYFDSLLSDIKKRTVFGELEFAKFKHILFLFLYQDSNHLIHSSLKANIMRQIEIIRFRYFSQVALLPSEIMQGDLLKYIKAQKSIMEYFSDDQKMLKVSMFIKQFVECLLYKIKPSSVAFWLNLHVKKPVDEIFFLALKPLLFEPLSRSDLSPCFLRGFQLKLEWIKLLCHVSFDPNSLLNRLPELLQNILHWINGMATSKQLNQRQLLKLSDFKNVGYFNYFITSVLTEDLFSFEDSISVLAAFGSSQEVVQFQLKGLKRILLLMKFKPKEAYEISDFLTSTFTESFYQSGNTNRIYSK